MDKKNIILTQEGLDRLKAELHNIITVKSPDAQREFEEVCNVWSAGDFPYYDTKTKCDFYKQRVISLEKIINNAIWNPDKELYESQE